MPKFSQRNGYMPTEKAFQREFADTALRTKLWNLLKVTIWDNYDTQRAHYDETSVAINDLMQRLWFHFFNRDLDAMPGFYGEYGRQGTYEILKEHFMRCEWFELYDLLEEIARDRSDLLPEEARRWVNKTLEHHNAAYRFVGDEIAEITDQNEIEAIESAMTQASSPVRAHLDMALKMLSNKEAPDYRNSIKESISAVEAECRILSGNQSATLNDALKRVQNLHPAMSRAFGQLYGYTSDASGIRHALTDEPTITYADAKFMLVTCAAFVSYLKTASTA